jgi:hypothetical protein
MDMNWIIGFLIFIVVASAAFCIIRWLIMPAVPAPAQPFVWAVIGILLLIGLLIFFSGSGTAFFHHGYTGR